MISKEKQELVLKFGGSQKYWDTRVQIAILTEDIESLKTLCC